MDIKTVRFFSPDYKFLGETDDAIVIYRSRWHTYGEFEIHLQQIQPYVKKDNRIVFGNDFRKNGIIKYIQIDDANAGTVVIKGFSLLHILTQRITVPDTGKDAISYNAPVEDIMVDLVLRNAIKSPQTARNIPNLVAAGSQGRGERIQYQTRYDDLCNELAEVSRLSMLGVGIRMDPDKKQDVFEVLEGVDRSIEQNVRSPVVFRRAYDNIGKTVYTLNDSLTKNCAYTAGQGEGADRAVYVVGDELSGAERKEIFIDARDIEDSSTLPERGRTKLSEYKPQENFETAIIADQYQSSWYMGDQITIIDDDTGITLSDYVVEIEETVDESGYEVIPTLGVPEGTIGSGSVSGGSSGSGGSGDRTYTFTKLTPDITWRINHNLDKYPSVTIVDSAGTVVFGDIEYIDRNSLTVTFTAGFAGQAYLN